ncbi:hypothetical protein TSTA_084590 [Talaromyces stipitatus ATCC 10500]|uniref:Uncharacterized protein n=1 Tax=Talaromyces stipitatus (strain ATCC 10500 / CBS 375.48 / QM 6759 / NRRL 1006) TaxID=441959 RepID=B8M0D1_TALSN|nr:uncharacterized protein TSTA_084590 [Talaromyces stipitatus ATCC 10500]EED21228.1 hypothetical protein TSTA_084590 [Talaromyces stipitatus ATCC 10500]
MKQKDTGSVYQNPFDDDHASSMSYVNSVHGSQERLIRPAETETSTPPSIPASILTLPEHEQDLIHRIHQLGLTECGWHHGGKSGRSLNRLERDLIQIPFRISLSNELSEFERLVLLRLHTNVPDHGINPLSLANHEQWAFISTVRKWLADQKPKPKPILKRILSMRK